MDYNYNYNYSTTATSGASSQLTAAAVLIMLLVVAVIILVAVISQWKIFKKAGKPGWAAIIPIYNVIVMCEIVGRPTWWVVLTLIPFVNIVVSIILALDLAKSFGKSTTFAVFGLIIFSLIGYPMLAFGSSTYQGPAGPEGKTPTTPKSPANQTPTTQAQTPPTTTVPPTKA